MTRVSIARRYSVFESPYRISFETFKPDLPSRTYGMFDVGGFNVEVEAILGEERLAGFRWSAYEILQW